MSDDETTAPEAAGERTWNLVTNSRCFPYGTQCFFPGPIAPFDVWPKRSRVALVEDLDSLEHPVLAIFAQRDPSTDEPGQDDLHPVGVAARVLKALKHSSGNYSLILQGLIRVRLEAVTEQAPYVRARVSKLQEPAAARTWKQKR